MKKTTTQLLTKALVLSLMLLSGLFAQAQAPTFYNYNTGGPSNSFPWATAAGKETQYLIGPGELAGGGGAYNGYITDVYFQVTASQSCSWTELTIKLGQSTITALPAQIVTGLTTCYYATSISGTSSSAGWLAFKLQTPFQYNPSQSLIVDVMQCSASTTGMLTINTASSAGRRNYMNVASCASTYQGQDANVFNFGVDMTLTGPGGLPQPPLANFFAPDTLWLNSPQTLVNTSSGYPSRVYWDLPDENPLPSGSSRSNVKFTSQQYLDTATVKNHFTYTFTSPGYKKVRMLAVNFFKPDSLRDSIEKFVYVDTPSRVPRPEFISFKRVVGYVDLSNFLDLSLYGPNSWEWSYNPPCNKCNNSQAGFFPNSFIPSAYVSSPQFFAGDPGIYDVCLKVTNARGWDTLCKPQYIKVVNSYLMCATTGTVQQIADDEGVLFASPSPNFSYTRSAFSGCQGSLIAPCADSIYLYVERAKLYTTDTLIVRNGNSPSSPIVGKISGPSGNVIKAGRFMKIEYKPGTGAATPGPNDTFNWTLRWAIKPASYPKPTAKFFIPDTVYSLSPITYLNQSIGTLMKYNWDTDGNGVFGAPADSTVATPTRSFTITSPTLKKICLVTYNCVGTDTACKTVFFLPITQKPAARFTVDKQTGFITDTFFLADKSLDGPASWQWTITPGGLKFQYLNGTTANSKNPIIRLNSDKDSFTVKLRVCNAFGCDSITKVKYLWASNYATPSSQFSPCPPNGDGTMGISRVQTHAPIVNGIDSGFPNSCGPEYQFITGNQGVNLFRGVKYGVSLSRTAPGANIDRKVWIDFNMNGSFDDAGELVMNQQNANSVTRTDSFLVAANQRTGTTRMRVAADLGNSPQFSSIRATMGVYKDFTLNLPVDTIRPIMQLLGANPLYVEKSKPYLDPGVIAIDNFEGDISAKYMLIGTVDTAVTGPNYLKYVVADLYGNASDTLYRTVFVELNRTGPSIALVGPSVFYTEVNRTFTDPGVIALDNQNNNISNQVMMLSNLDTAKLGSYTITYMVTDAFGLKAQVIRLVTVGDTTRPVVQPKVANPYIHQVAQQLDLAKAVKLSDNYWPENNLLLSYNGFIDVNKVGVYYIIYSARDGSGNIGNDYTLTIQVKDTVRPSIQLLGLPEMDVEVFATFNDPGYVVNDNYWPINAITVTVTGTVNTSSLGAYTLTYTACDASANCASVTRRVNVVKTAKPRIVLLGASPLNIKRWKNINDPGVSLVDAYYSDAELRPFLSVDSAAVNVAIEGLYAIKYNVKDPLGNQANEVLRSVYVSGEDGLNDAAAATGISIYPVPSKGAFTVESRGADIIKSINVINILGEVVASADNPTAAKSIAINLDNYPAGIYIIRIATASGLADKRVSVVR